MLTLYRVRYELVDPNDIDHGNVRTHEPLKSYDGDDDEANFSAALADAPDGFFVVVEKGVDPHERVALCKLPDGTILRGNA